MKINKFSAMFSRIIETAHTRTLSVILIAVVALILGLSAAVIGSTTKANAAQEGNVTMPFAVAEIIFETNFTDEDTGIQLFLDGEPWANVQLSGPDRKRLVNVQNKGSLENFGLTELFSESNEPNYDELPLAEILALFPAGEYRFSGKTVNGDNLVGEAMLTHTLPCGPEVIVVIDGPDDVTITWAPVTTTIDPATETCTDPNEPLVIDGYQIIVTNETTDHTLNVDLPADVTGMTVPPEFLEPGTEYGLEVLAIEESGNQTITEDGFSTPP